MTSTAGEAVESRGPIRRLLHRYAHASWWVHTLVTLAVVFALVVIAAGASAAFFIDFASERGPLSAGIPAQTAVEGSEAKELATRFSPILRYDSLERFVPISRSAYLSRTMLRREENRVARTIRKVVGEGDLPDKLGDCGIGCFLFLDVRGVEPNPPSHSEAKYEGIADALLDSGAKRTVYYHVTKYDDTGDYAVQFWFLYLFNYRLNEHESDWEQITVRLDEDKEPVSVLYSAHETANKSPWAKIEKLGDHPVVYPARGSHANYFEKGKHRVEIVCRRLIGSIKPCLKGRTVVVDVSDADGPNLKLGEYQLAELQGPIFAGSYGSGNYVVVTRKPDVLRDPRARSAWRDPLANLR